MTPVEIEPATFRFVAQHLNHCATAVPKYKYTFRKYETSFWNVVVLSLTALMALGFFIVQASWSHLDTPHSLGHLWRSISPSQCFYLTKAVMTVGLLIVYPSWSHSDTAHSVGLLCTTDRPIAEASTSQHTQHSSQTDIHVPGGTWNRNPNKRAAADANIKPRGQPEGDFNISVL